MWHRVTWRTMVGYDVTLQDMTCHDSTWHGITWHGSASYLVTLFHIFSRKTTYTIKSDASPPFIKMWINGHLLFYIYYTEIPVYSTDLPPPPTLITCIPLPVLKNNQFSAELLLIMYITCILFDWCILSSSEKHAVCWPRGESLNTEEAHCRCARLWMAGASYLSVQYQMYPFCETKNETNSTVCGSWA